MKKRNLIIMTFVLGMIVSMAGCDKQKQAQDEPKKQEQAKQNYTYKVKKLETEMVIDANWDKPQWADVEALEIKNFMGDKPEHFPIAQAKLMYDDENIYVIFKVDDNYIKAVAKEYHDAVWQDSCVEFFFVPSGDLADGYFNLETNCGANFLFCHQHVVGQDTIKVATEDCDKVEIKSTLPRFIEEEITEPTTWTLEYRLPLSILEKYAPVGQPAPGVKWRANFFKCGDETSHPHWLTWSFIDYPTPRFHMPEFFGVLEFE